MSERILDKFDPKLLKMLESSEFDEKMTELSPLKKRGQSSMARSDVKQRKLNDKKLPSLDLNLNIKEVNMKKESEVHRKKESGMSMPYIRSINSDREGESDDMDKKEE